MPYYWPLNHTYITNRLMLYLSLIIFFSFFFYLLPHKCLIFFLYYVHSLGFIYTTIDIFLFFFFLSNLLNLFTVTCDAPKPWDVYFQDSASPQMEALVELHDNIMFYLVIILFGVAWVMLSIIRNYVNTKSPISNKQSGISLWWDRLFLSSNAKYIITLYIIFELFSGMLGTAFFIFNKLELSGPDVEYIANNWLYYTIIVETLIIIIFFVFPLLPEWLVSVPPKPHAFISRFILSHPDPITNLAVAAEVVRSGALAMTPATIGFAIFVIFIGIYHGLLESDGLSYTDILSNSSAMLEVLRNGNHFAISQLIHTPISDALVQQILQCNFRSEDLASVLDMILVSSINQEILAGLLEQGNLSTLLYAYREQDLSIVTIGSDQKVNIGHMSNLLVLMIYQTAYNGADLINTLRNF